MKFRFKYFSRQSVESVSLVLLNTENREIENEHYCTLYFDSLLMVILLYSKQNLIFIRHLSKLVK